MMTLPASRAIVTTRRVLLISTSRDLAAHRERVHEALARVDGLSLLPAEPAPSVRGDAEVISSAALRAADVCVLLVAWRYGHLPPGEMRSLTHSAYLEARAAGLPILVFLADPATDARAGPETPFPAVARDPTHRAQLLAFRAELEFAHAVRYFITPGDLAASVTSAAAALLAELHADQRRLPTMLYPRGPRTPRDLPPRVSGFVDRERERAALLDALRRGQSVSLSAVVAGMAGVGTSGLAAEALHALAHEPDAFAGGIAWVRCDARSGLDGLAWIYDRVLAAWGAALPADASPGTLGTLPAEAAVELRERALRQLRSMPSQEAGSQTNGTAFLPPALLLLDDVERHLPLDRALRTLAPLAITVLVTTATRHRAALPHLRLLSLDVLDTSAAIRLFASRYCDRGGSWDTDADAVAARFVVELLGRLPLAIELAAARAAHLRQGVHALGDELAVASRQHRLTGPLDTAPGVRYVLEQTLAGLSSTQRARFAALALPDGPDWPLPIVERLLTAISAGAPDTTAARADLETFASLSLITVSTSHAGHSSGTLAQPRVHLHPLLRDLALAEWERQPDEVRRAAAPALLAALDAYVAAYRADPAALAREEELMRGALRAAARYVDADLLAATAARWSECLRASASAPPSADVGAPAGVAPAGDPGDATAIAVAAQPATGASGGQGGPSDDVSAIATARLDPPPVAQASAPIALSAPTPAPPSRTPPSDISPDISPSSTTSDQIPAPARRRRRWWHFGRAHSA